MLKDICGIQVLANVNVIFGVNQNNIDHENCICKNKLIGRIIEEYTSVINETMINNKDNIANDNTITNIFIGLFSVLLFVGIVCFYVFAYFKWIKGKKLFRKKYIDY